MGVHDMDRYDEVKVLLGIPADEPIFILRGQDKYAAVAVDDYVRTVYTQERDERGGPRDLRLWRQRGDEHAERFFTWQDENTDKLKAPD